ncbi:hypothetical protein BH10BAC3_BH10BAC3_34510 [soil metagenome]
MAGNHHGSVIDSNLIYKGKENILRPIKFAILICLWIFSFFMFSATVCIM